jgi:excisionase family DNA binding protein
MTIEKKDHRFEERTADGEPPRLYTVAQTARLLGIGVSKTYDLLYSGQLDSVKIGRSRRIPTRAIDAYIHRLEGGAAS